MRTTTLLLALLLSFGANSQAQPADDLARGKLLYTTHCIACHAVKIHWREKKLVGNWGDLKMQVNRWQENAGLKWSKDDVGQVSNYLNATYYHFTVEGKIGPGKIGLESSMH